MLSAFHDRSGLESFDGLHHRITDNEGTTHHLEALDRFQPVRFRQGRNIGYQIISENSHNQFVTERPGEAEETHMSWVKYIEDSRDEDGPEARRVHSATIPAASVLYGIAASGPGYIYSSTFILMSGRMPFPSSKSLIAVLISSKVYE